MPFQYPLYACTVTVPATKTPLLTLINSLGGKYALCEGSCRFSVQCDTANGYNILVGDEMLAASPQNCMANLSPDGSESFDNVPIGVVSVMQGAGTSGASLLNVAVYA